jgi:hypothetical protein
MNYKAKISLNPTAVTINFPHGNIQGITAAQSPDESKVCRLSHSSFSESGTFVQCTLIEQSDIESTMMAATGDGIIDIYCYGTDAQLQGSYYFQKNIDVV